eukprot:TRINITY_DN10204_c0_g1_i1.p1 TRINITY_DN10204_c0_g1~~TRINITY_DN10204_c0_g1_i1.p1  ORF type:complete len:254 (-),score=29.13 TRINITY_DN10204_c0_g1_i1:498-1259(-)
MPTAVKTYLTRAFGENGLDEDQFLLLCQNAGYICSTFQETDARALFKQMGSTGTGTVTIKQIDSALDRIAAMRIGHLQKFAGVCAQMVRDQEFRRVRTELSLGASGDLGKSQSSLTMSPAHLLSPSGVTSSSFRRRRANFGDVAGSPVHTLGKSASITMFGQPAVSKGKYSKAPQLPKAFGKPMVLRNNSSKVLADYKSPWGGSANHAEDPDYFVADNYSPGMMWNRSLGKSESSPILTTTQLFRNVLGGASA